MRIESRSVLGAATVCLAIACGGGGGSKGSTPPPGPARSLSGAVTYDFVPAVYDPASHAGGLSFGAAVARPVRSATVQVVKGASVLATTTTDAAGHYALSFSEPAGAGVLGVQVLAESTAPVIRVVDNTDGKAIWAVGEALGATTTTMNLHAPHGWTGAAYDPASRAAAPFAILDSMYTAARAFLAVRTVAFPELVVNWSPNNAPAAGNKALGQIGTSHFSPGENQIYVLGKEGVDTDEFDAHVIVHEWAHYFERNLSRADSPGGPHGGGDILDPRLSFGEGYGNALAAMLLPESVYADTVWSGGAIAASGFDAETAPTPNDDPAPSAMSELSIMRLLYDLFDGGTNEAAYDGVSVGLGVMYDVLVGPQKTTQALTTIGSFVAGLKAHASVDAAAEAAVDALLGHYGIGPITDEWGAGDPNLAPMYVRMTALPATHVVALTGGYDYNKWQQNQYYVFSGTGNTMTVSATSADDVAVIVYRVGTQVGFADSYLTGTESVTFVSTNGATYVVNVVGFRESAGDYDVQTQISSL